jgi:hypothetical protein
MVKSTNLNFTQTFANPTAVFVTSDILSVVAVSPNVVGSGSTIGTRTYTAAAGTLQTGGSAAAWTATVTDGRVIGPCTITVPGSYLVTPTAVANPATIDSGTTTSTFNLRVENYKVLYTASADDSVVKAINVSSLDTAARVMSVWIVGSDNQPRLIGAVNIPLSSGNSGAIATIDLLGGTLLPSLPYDANGKRVIPLKAGQKLALSVPAITVGTQIYASAFVEEY